MWLYRSTARLLSEFLGVRTNMAFLIKVLEHRARKSGDTFRVELPQTDKLPQMRDLTLRYGKLAWNPDDAKP